MTTWSVLIGLGFVLALGLAIALSRRAELRRMATTVKKRETAVRQGAAEAQLQHPVVDLTRCLGCGTCVAVCPEDGVLDLVHGQAMVVNGARCVGVSACERECPVDAITVTLTNLDKREDIPVLDPGLEAVGTPGLFLAGEVTAHALIKTAIEHGTAVGAEVARRCHEEPTPDRRVFDLVVVGAGPAGLAASLEARANGLRFVTLEQELELGGTVAKYPRQKLVMTLPVDMPLHGRLKSRTYSKEQLMELWHEIAEANDLPIRFGEVFVGIQHAPEGHFVVRTKTHAYRARHVCMAIGRRGVPRRLEIPGEELPKVAYSLLDAHSYTHRRLLVVGGGDSAIETALALAEQEGNEVTLSYRKESFFRIKAANEAKIERAIAEGRVRPLFASEVMTIQPEHVDLCVHEGDTIQNVRLPNDNVFVMAGGVPPFELLRNAGVSFDPELREKTRDVGESGTGLVRALTAGLLLTLGAAGFALWHQDYYSLPLVERPTHPKHEMLRPGMGIGLGLGIASAALILLNLAYLLRRSPKIRFHLGSLQLWMTSHVATGILALLCALLHGAMTPRDTPGGQAFWALVVLLVTGAIGRYFYSYVPRAANGRELELDEVRSRLRAMGDEWDQGQRQYREQARAAVEELVERRQWKGSFLGRVLALCGVRRDLNRLLADLEQRGREQGVADDQIEETRRLARRAHRTALMVAHYEDLRAILGTWRYMHRWVAVLMVVLVIVHVIHALAYGSFFQEGGAR